MQTPNDESPLPIGLDPGPFGYGCTHMLYRPKSPPDFAGDIQHDFRDYQIALCKDFLATVVGDVTRRYISAATMVNMRDDPLLDSLQMDDFLDVSGLVNFHRLMARIWRRNLMPVHHAEKHVYYHSKRGGLWLRCSYAGMHASFQDWALNLVEAWAERDPIMVRLICKVCAWGSTTSGLAAQVDLLTRLAMYDPASAPFPKSETPLYRGHDKP